MNDGGGDADATRSQAPAVAEVAQPVVAATLGPGDTISDDPERYLIDGQIGAGGMGMVMSAKGEYLGRAVAVKVITADREDLRRRFEREAKVTARLQHPAIVPVYGSGRNRDGRPFYAMKHVTGEPLDKVIAKSASLNERIALLPKVIAVTEAIAYAHAEKVIHRDLKPANILVGAFGETVVIDWGLAKDLRVPDGDDELPLEGPYRSEAADGTAVGKVMGTPAYMPLEQARGEAVDERADVYALGAILYHVLAGRAPYKKAGEDSVAWESMVARVLTAPPEPLDADAPADLLAIVARAMAREPDQRYPSARELAEDLRRFQTGQLVGAHRYSTWQLVRRWLRRHRAAVTVAAVATVTLAVVAVVGLQRIFAEQQRTSEQRDVADQRRRDSEKLLRFMVGDMKDKLAPIGRLDLLDSVATKATEYFDAKVDGLSAEDRSSLERAKQNLGDVLMAQGHGDRALAQFRSALELATAVAADYPADTLRAAELARAHEKIAETLLQQANTAGARAEYGEALAIDDRIATLEPENASFLENLSTDHSGLGDALTQEGNLTAALPECRAALAPAEKLRVLQPAMADRSRNLSILHNRVAEVLGGLGDAAGALQELRASESLLVALLDKDPGDADVHRDLAISRIQLGDALLAKGDAPAALAMYKDVRQIFESLAAKDPTNASRRSDLAIALSKLGELELALDDAHAALADFQRSLELHTKLAAADPTNARWQGDVGTAHEKMGDAKQKLGDLAGALAEFREALAIDDHASAADPANVRARRAVLAADDHIGDVLVHQHNQADALVAFRAALEIAEALVKAEPASAVHQADLESVLEEVGDTLLATHDPTGALARYREELAIAERRSAAARANVALELDVLEVDERIGDALAASGDAAGARAEWTTALASARAVAATAPDSAPVKKQLASLEAKAAR